MMNQRLQMQRLPGHAVQGSALNMPFPSASMDFVVSIGCFHHTGNVQRCLDETWRVLRPGGDALIMVYNKFSLRHWLHWPWWSFRELLREFGLRRRPTTVLHEQVKAADQSETTDHAAPETAFLSKRDLYCMFHRFEQIQIIKRNYEDLTVRGKKIIPRSLLYRIVGPLCGLDLYARATKPCVEHKAQAA
jgi:ubiquinone/menaquinone biosynthesis C-methylase UbiE